MRLICFIVGFILGFLIAACLSAHDSEYVDPILDEQEAKRDEER